MDSLTADKDLDSAEEDSMRSTRCGWRGTVKVTKGEGLFPKQKDRGQKDRGGGRCPGRKPKFRATDKAKK